MTRPIGRREFLRVCAAVSAALAPAVVVAQEPKRPRLRKAVKYGMIQLRGSHKDRLDLARRCGFAGVEIDSPGTQNLDDLVAAAKETGVVIHGVVDSVHWTDTLSHADAAVRARGLAALTGALDDARKVGATTVLLVPGVVNRDVTVEQCWERSTAEVRRALPLAEKLGVKIAIEVVWNNFITTPEQLIRYVDQFRSDHVAAYFDCSNMIKYGVAPAEWIRRLGRRMVKFDFKGYSKNKEWVPIGDGDEDWPEVLKALGEVGYDGWATAEVQGGGEDVLRRISAQMDRVLGLS